MDFIARLAALVPKPRVNLTRFHGVFAPNSNHRKLVTSDKKEKGKGTKAEEGASRTEAEKRRGMTWAQRLKRVFDIDIQTCAECGGFVKVIACIEEPDLIKKILAHVNQKQPQAGQDNQLPELRAPPQIQGNLFN